MIVVFGSLNIDFVTQVARLPLPGETVLGSTYAVFPGGKGANQALAARRAGAKVAMVGAVGDDPHAETALHLLARDGVDVSGVARVAEPTGAAFIAVDDNGANAIVVAGGANRRATASQIDALALGPGDTLVLQREIPDREGEAAAIAAKRRGVRVVLNLAPGGGVSARWLEALDLLIMNETETALLGSALGLGGGDLQAVAAAVARDYAAAVIVTLGPEGAVGWSGGQRYAASPLPVAVLDTTAAGDAFVGAAAAALDRGRPFAEALADGVAAGTLACTKPGAQPSLPWRADIETMAAKGG